MRNEKLFGKPWPYHRHIILRFGRVENRHPFTCFLTYLN
jgi:hypothetical protein